MLESLLLNEEIKGVIFSESCGLRGTTDKRQPPTKQGDQTAIKGM